MSWLRKTAGTDRDLRTVAIKIHHWAVAGDHYGLNLPWLEELEDVLKNTFRETGLTPPWESDRPDVIDVEKVETPLLLQHEER